MSSTNLSVRVDGDLKKRFEEVIGNLGLNPTAAINVFIRAVVREERIPFDVALKKESPYDPVFVASVKESMDQIRRGRVIAFDSVEALEKYAQEKRSHAN